MVYGDTDTKKIYKNRTGKYMPSYEYNCTNCDIYYTKIRGIKEKDPGYKCDTCKSSLIRVYSNIGVTFNGSGFYKTDNRK
jgi:putative FmdB family regulatory protein